MSLTTTKHLNTLKKFYINNTSVSTLTTRVRMLSFGIDTAPQSFCHTFIALSMIRYSKSAHKSAIVVMETTQLVLSQF